MTSSYGDELEYAHRPFPLWSYSWPALAAELVSTVSLDQPEDVRTSDWISSREFPGEDAELALSDAEREEGVDQALGFGLGAAQPLRCTENHFRQGGIELRVATCFLQHKSHAFTIPARFGGL